MAESFLDEIYSGDELTVPCIVPLQWVDGQSPSGTVPLRARRFIDYEALRLGTAGQDSARPSVKLLSEQVPYAAEGATLVVDEINYTAARAYKSGAGETIVDLFVDDEL